jgi:hypothetical protein
VDRDRERDLRDPAGCAVIALLLEVLAVATAGLAVVAGSAAMVRIVQLAASPEHPRDAWVRHVRRELRSRGEYVDPSISVVRLRRGTAVRRADAEFYDLTAWSDLDETLRRHWDERWAAALSEIELGEVAGRAVEAAP